MTNDQIDQELENMMLEDQPLDEEDKNLLELIYDRLDIFQQLNQQYHDKAKECRQILHMEDPSQDDPEILLRNGKKTLQLQTLKSTINNVVADQMLSMPEAKLLPETADMQDAADDLQDMVHYVIYCANDFEHTHYRLCEDFYGAGTMVLQTAWDPDMAYGKGEIALIRWPLEAFLWDPTAENIQDCRAVMKVSWHPRSWYRDHWPDEGRYVGAEKGAHNNVGMTEGQEDVEHNNDEERSLLIEYWWREYDAKTRRYSINVAYAAGNALLDVQRDVYNHGLYPFSILPHDTIEGCLAGDSLVRELAPMMRYINRYAAYADMNARMSSKGRMLVQRGSGIDKEALANWETDIVEGDRITQGDSWNWMQNQPFNSTITNLMTMFQSDLKADSGANQFTRGETTGGIVSGKAINSLIQAGGKISSMRTEQIKYFFKDMVEQIVWLMSQFYDDDRVMMITGRKGRRELKVDTKRLFGKKGKGGVNPPPYTVQIEVSSRDPQRIANQNQMFMEAYTMSAQAQQFFPLSALFNILNLDGKDKILPVIKANEHYQEQMQALQQQVEQMGQQLEQLQTEKQNLQQMAMQTSDTLSAVAAKKGGGPQPAMPPAGPGGEENPNAIVDSNRNMMGVPTGAALPT
jgi:hypothetical protein